MFLLAKILLERKEIVSQHLLFQDVGLPYVKEKYGSSLRRESAYLLREYLLSAVRVLIPYV